MVGRSDRPARGGAGIGIAVALLLGSTGCGDEVIGTWDGDCELVALDEFDDAQLDPDLWKSWSELDSNWIESDGRFVFTPATAGLYDTGLTTWQLTPTRFDGLAAQVEIPAPPDPSQPVIFFLQVNQEPATLNFTIAEGVMTVRGKLGDEEPWHEQTFPELPVATWISIRLSADGSEVFYEVSEDGLAWTTIAGFSLPEEFDDAKALLMTQTYGSVPEPSAVEVETFRICRR